MAEWAGCTPEQIAQIKSFQNRLKALELENTKLEKTVSDIKSVRTVQSYLKPKPPAFDSTRPDEALKFIIGIKDYFQLLGVPEKDWLANIPFALDEISQRWFIHKKNAFKTFQDFEDLFKQTFV